ncbi:DNA polymerase V subunit UmuC, partial [Acinetobacter baumannii]
MQRTILELQGQACIPLEPKPPAKKQIISSRSFGQKINNLQDLKEAATLFTQNAVRRLRADEQLCGEITGFVQSNPFSKTEKYYSKAVVYRFPEPTDCVLDIVKISTALMNQAYMPNINFKKC